MARLHHLSVLDVELREWVDDEGRRYKQWLYEWCCRGCIDFTEDGQLCQGCRRPCRASTLCRSRCRS